MGEIKKRGIFNFKLAGMLNLKLKKPAIPEDEDADEPEIEEEQQLQACRHVELEAEEDAQNLKLETKPATPAKKCINPFTKEPCVFKVKPASKTVRALAMKKLREALN